MKTISILNQKGEVGKTTIARSLSDGLAVKGYKVLRIDADY
jgi:chromosome partitioning protein